MSKNLLKYSVSIFSLSFSLFSMPSYAVKTASPEDDVKALEMGKRAPAVCYLKVLNGESTDNASLDQGSGALVRPNIIITAAHMFLSDFKDKKITPGVPQKASGFVTFAANGRQTLADYENDPTPANLSNFYEIDSVILHPNYEDKFAAPHDIAFIKLKKPVEDIVSLPLYTKGMIPESKLKIHNQSRIAEESMNVAELLIDTYAYGYGKDVFQKDGQKRGIYLPSFIGLDDTPFECSSSEYTNSSNDSSEDSEDSAAVRASKTNEGEVIPIVSYFPGPRVLKENRSFSKAIHITQVQNQFHDILYEIVKEKAETSGIIHSGDSGGPLLVSGAIVGLNNTADEYGGFLDRVEDFSGIPELYRSVYSFATPLFNYQTGELRPELPEMIETLQAHPCSEDSHLNDLLLFNKRKELRWQEVRTALTMAATDLESLLLPNLTFETFNGIVNKYAEGKNSISIDFEQSLDFFQGNDLESFRKNIENTIEGIQKILTLS